mgnify:CR=1 FL=1
MESLILEYIRTKGLEPFPVDQRGFYHNMVSLIISARIRFSVARCIRSKLYTILGCDSLDNITTLSDAQLIESGLSPAKVETIKSFHKLYKNIGAKGDFTIVRGIGPWTINCAKIMAGDYSCGFLDTDSSVNVLVRKIVSSVDNKPDISRLFKDDRELGGRVFSALWNSIREK